MKFSKRILCLSLLLWSASCACATTVIQDLSGASKPDGSINGVPLEVGQSSAQAWVAAGGSGVYFLNDTLAFGSRGGFGKAQISLRKWMQSIT